MRTAGGGGEGWEDASCKRWITESAGSAGSVCCEKSWSGLLPVDENSETMLGCVEVMNMQLEEVEDLIY
jgi:hypothetical protein